MKTENNDGKVFSVSLLLTRQLSSSVDFSLYCMVGIFNSRSEAIGAATEKAMINNNGFAVSSCNCFDVYETVGKS